MDPKLIIISFLFLGIFLSLGYYISKKYKLRGAFLSFFCAMALAFVANEYRASALRIVAPISRGEMSFQEKAMETNEVLASLVLDSSFSGFFWALALTLFVLSCTFVIRRFLCGPRQKQMEIRLLRKSHRSMQRKSIKIIG